MISILEAMLEPNAPDLSIQLNSYLEYMNEYYKAKYYLNRKLEGIEYVLTRLKNVQKSVENINTSQE
jgi:hypothetical protein